jgi:hypothetical protein
MTPPTLAEVLWTATLDWFFRHPEVVGRLEAAMVARLAAQLTTESSASIVAGIAADRAALRALWLALQAVTDKPPPPPVPGGDSDTGLPGDISEPGDTTADEVDEDDGGEGILEPR